MLVLESRDLVTHFGTHGRTVRRPSVPGTPCARSMA